MADLSPIALFVYNRPEHTKRLLESLNRCDEIRQSEVYVFADGPKPGQELSQIMAVRHIIKNFVQCRKLHLIEADKNKGLADSIISGVTSLVNEYGRVIVLEDDLVLASGFLKYMNQALDYYQDEEKVMQISGHMFPIKIEIKEDAFFLPLTTSWGWATWRRAWDSFDPNADGYEVLQTDAGLRRRFNIGNSYDYSGMLLRQMEGQIDSWAIRWYWSFFKNNGLALFPRETLVINKGMDGSGTHCSDNKENYCNIFNIEFDMQRNFSFPTQVVENKFVLTELITYLKSSSRPFQKVKHSVGRLLAWLK